MKHILILSPLIIWLGACSPDASHKPGKDHMSHQSEAAQTEALSELKISKAWIRRPLPGRAVTAAYFDLENIGAADTLISATSPISDKVEIHAHIKDGNVMRMRRVDGVPIPKGLTQFKPGGLHIMIFDVKLDETALTTPLTLNFASGRSVTRDAMIGEGQDQSSSHSGH